MELLEQHKKAIQRQIETMPPGTEMKMMEIYKQYKDFYPMFQIYEEIQRVLRLNHRRYTFYKRDPLTGSIIQRVEEYT
jgi:hypothetical protein